MRRKSGPGKKFTHRPLSQPGHIRLLTLHPSKQRWRPIRCTLDEVSLQDDHPPPYTALSYVWGNPRDRGFINIRDGLLESSSSNFKYFKATVNLVAALRHIRKYDEDLHIWIDAICINQKDLHERASQVLLMRDIYRLADHVLVWLGQFVEEEDSEDDPLDAKELPQGITEPLGIRQERRTESMKRTLSFINRIGTILCTVDDGDESALVRLWAAFDSDNVWSIAHMIDLFNRNWFTRVWVIQEALLTKGSLAFQCGDIVLKESLTSNLQVFSALGTDMRAQILANAMTRINHEYTQLPVVDRTIDALLFIGLCLDATDPRDTLYGMLGIIDPPAGVPALTPDYTQDISTFWLKTIRYTIEESGTLRILQGGYGRPRHKALPTWIPTGRRSGLTYATTYPSSDKLRAATHFSFWANGMALTIQALDLGTLCWATPITDEDIPSQKLQRILESNEAYLKTNEKTAKRYNWPDGITEHLCPLYYHIADSYGFTGLAEKIGRRQEKFTRYEIYMGRTEWPGDIRYPEKSRREEMQRFEGNPIESIPQYYIFATSEGYIGKIIAEGRQCGWHKDSTPYVSNEERESRVFYVPGCPSPLLMLSKPGDDKFIIKATCEVAGLKFDGLAEHLEVFEREKEKMRKITII